MRKIYCLLLICAFSDCKTQHISDSKPDDLHDWTLAPVPNSLDQVGTIYSIDRKKNYHYITAIRLENTTGIAAIPEREWHRTTSINALLKFLKIPVLDSAAQIGAKDSITVNSVFHVDSAKLTRTTAHVVDSFTKNKKDIIDQLNFYNLQNNQVVMITQVIQSPTVNIAINRESYLKPQVNATIAKLINLNAGVSINGSDSSSLNYKLQTPLSILYILQPINLNVIHFRGAIPKDSVADIKLGANIVKSN